MSSLMPAIIKGIPRLDHTPI